MNSIRIEILAETINETSDAIEEMLNKARKSNRQLSIVDMYALDTHTLRLIANSRLLIEEATKPKKTFIQRLLRK